MSAITTKFVTDHELTNEMSLKELSQNAPEILELLTDDKEKRRQARNRLLNGYKFSKEQVFALIPLQRVGRCKSQAPVPEGSGLEAEEVNTCQVSDSTCTEETIKETAQRIVRDKLSERDVKAISRTLIETASDSVVALSHLSRLRRELRTLNVPETIISATFNPEVTRLSNKIQKERSNQCEDEGIDFPDHFSLESVTERQNLYDVSNISDKQALADVMIMLCICPAEIKNLRISNGDVTGYAKNRGQQDIPWMFRSLEKNEKRARELLTWIQKAISSGQLRDPGKLGSTERDVKAISRTLIETASDSVVALSHLSRLRRELRTLNVPETIISATFNPEVTRLSNKIQKERSDQREDEGIDFPDHFSLESVTKRLNLYDVSNIPDKQALADIMIMLCIRSAEIKNLRISNGGVTGYAKNRGQQDIPRMFRSLEKNEKRARELLTWIQKAISSGQLRDPGKLGSTYLSTFLKKDEFIPETERRKPLLPSSLHKLGAVFAVVSNGVKNLSEAMTIASQALRHSLDNHASPAQNYTIVNFRWRGQPYDQAKAFKLSNEN
ncbi:hypothetical protein C2G38_2163098 [Gigaspora rosea]|uniref:Uncharacterized protein n=1 Tax=Gigaspora rosea TaxID=44941 RepID=A0A397VXQ8_9GLOM|nr:hypothetical protein C2G38_2163098 [Gigaspora rosea]